MPTKQFIAIRLVFMCYLSFHIYIYVSIYLRANQRVQPLDCLRMPDDAVHPIYVEHDLPQG